MLAGCLVPCARLMPSGRAEYRLQVQQGNLTRQYIQHRIESMSLAGGSGASDHTQSHEDQQAQPERLTVHCRALHC